MLFSMVVVSNSMLRSWASAIDRAPSIPKRRTDSAPSHLSPSPRVGCQVRFEAPDTVAPQVIALVRGLRIFALIGNIVSARDAQAVAKARVGFTFAQIQNIPMPSVPIVKVGTILQGVGMEAVRFLVQRANCVRSRPYPSNPAKRP